MKIDGSIPLSYNPAPALSGTDPSKKPESVGNDPEAAHDEARLSSISHSGDLLSQLKQMPDVRQQRVEALREAIDRGRYNPSDRQIADALYAKLLRPALE